MIQATLQRSQPVTVRDRAEAHAGSARSPRPTPPHALLLLIAACGQAPEAGAPDLRDASGNPATHIQALLDAYEPVDPAATSDKHDAALLRRRELMAKLREGDRDLGLAAWAAFRGSGGERDELRNALLEVAAVCDPLGSGPMLERMVVTYDAELGLGVRTRAAELLAEVTPDRALALLGPLCTGGPTNVTLPPRESLVRFWARAARGTGVEDLGVLVDVAVDITQLPETRYAALEELGQLGGAQAKGALEEVLFEDGSDAYLRRKAAQGLEACLPPAELCPILERAGAHEHDEVFAQFLASLLAQYCP